MSSSPTIKAYRYEIKVMSSFCNLSYTGEKAKSILIPNPWNLRIDIIDSVCRFRIEEDSNMEKFIFNKEDRKDYEETKKRMKVEEISLPRDLVEKIHKIAKDRLTLEEKIKEMEKEMKEKENNLKPDLEKFFSASDEI